MNGIAARRSARSWLAQLRPPPGAGGRRAEFDAAWDAIRPRVWALVARVSGSAEAADDLTQEVAVRAVESLDGFRGGAELSTWLYRIAVNTALRNREQRHARRGDTMTLDGPAADRLPGPATHSPEASLLRAERMPRVRAALDALPDDLHTVLVLRVFEDLSYREIAAVLDVPVGTVMSRLHAARARMRATLPEEVDDASL